MMLGIVSGQVSAPSEGAPPDEPPEEPDGEWVVAIETGVTGNSSQPRPRNVRQLLPTLEPGSSGDIVRVTFRLGTSSGDMTVNSAYIGHGSQSGDAFDFESTPTPITFGGLSSFVLPWTDGLDHVSDEIEFSLDETKPLLITYYVAGDYHQTSVTLANGGTYFDVGGADEAGTVDVSSYGSGQSPAIRTIAKVEVFQPA